MGSIHSNVSIDSEVFDAFDKDEIETNTGTVMGKMGKDNVDTPRSIEDTPQGIDDTVDNYQETEEIPILSKQEEREKNGEEEEKPQLQIEDDVDMLIHGDVDEHIDFNEENLEEFLTEFEDLVDNE